MSSKEKLLVIFLTLAGGMIAGHPHLTACDVPVYRYALERWPADPYQLIVFHQGPLSADIKKIVDRASDDHLAYANYTVHLVDLAEKVPEPLQELWHSLDARTLPYLVLRYPVTTGIKTNLWAGPLTQENFSRLLDSPVRRQIAEKIIKGETAVWILLESGQRQEDNAAYELLNSSLKQLKNLTPPALASTHELVLADTNTNPVSAIAFSIIRLSRQDPAESLLIAMLLNSEPDLIEYRQYPMVFPIFGRARILFSLVGKGINAENIQDARAFLTGPCVCEIKALNLGLDLLVATDWSRVFNESQMVQEELPPLTGFSGFIEPTDTTHLAGANGAGPVDDHSHETIGDSMVTSSNTTVDSLVRKAVPKRPSKVLARNLLIVFALGLGGIIVVTFFLKRREVKA